MIGMAAVLIGTSAITFSYASDRQNNIQMQPPQMSQQGGMQEQGQNPFESFGGDNQQGPQQNNQQMPQPPQDNQQNGQSTQDNQQSNQPPQAPQNGEQQNSQPEAPQNNQQQSSDNASGDSSDSSASNNAAQSKTNTSADSEELTATDVSKQMMPQAEKGSVVGSVTQVLCYLFGGLQIIIVAAILLELILSKFNKLSFNQILSKSIK